MPRGRVVGGVVAAVLSGLASVSAGASTASFAHGVASGDPLADGVILWTRVTPVAGGALEVRWEVADDEAMRRIVQSGVAVTDGERDNTVKVDVRGLRPDRRYYYRFSVDGITSPIGRTRTLPEGRTSRLQLAVFSCANYAAGYFEAYRHAVARDDIDVVVHLGDYLYEYARGRYADKRAAEIGREHEPEGELLTLADYRRRHAQYRTDPDLAALHRRFPFVVVWDDHELANDAWVGGAENHGADEGEWSVRRAAAVRAYHEWMPIRAPPADQLGKIYRRFDFGDLVSLILLDTRVAGRDQQPSYGDQQALEALDPEWFRRQVLEVEDRSILGREQEDWLGRQLRDSASRGIRWQVLGQQLILAPTRPPRLDGLVDFVRLTRRQGYVARIRALDRLGLPWNLDAWDGYPAARRRLYRDVLAQASNLVVLTGDSHNAWAFDLFDVAGRQVGVELATTSVTSPGLEAAIPAPPLAVLPRLRGANPHLAWGDAEHRGYLLVTIRRRSVVAQWMGVEDIRHRGGRERCLGAMRATATPEPGVGPLRKTWCRR